MYTHAFEIHRHRGSLDEVVLGPVAQFYEEMHLEGSTGYFVRGWTRGNHIRVHVRSDSTACRPGAETIRDRLAELATPIFQRSERLDARSEERLQHEERLSREEMRTELPAWRPDLNVYVEPYDQRLQVHGRPEHENLQASFLEDTNTAVITLLRSAQERNDKLRAGVMLLVDVSQLLARNGLLDLFPSFESHAEGYLFRADPEGRTRQRWRAAFERNEETLIEWATVQSDPLGDPLISTCSGRASAWVARIRSHVREFGGNRPAVLASSEPLTPGSEMSSFHRSLLSNDFWRTMVARSEDFQAIRCALNFAYLQLTRLGLTPRDRYFLAYLLARAGERTAGMTALERIGEMECWEWPDD